MKADLFRTTEPIPEAASSELCRNTEIIVGRPWRSPTVARHYADVILRVLQAPRVSVVLPVWNGEAFLEQAMESILRQTLSSFELIAIDDGSTDRTAPSARATTLRPG